MHITLQPIATVSNKIIEPIDDSWGDTVSEISLLPTVPTEAFDGIEDFSHLEIIYFFNRAEQEQMVYSGMPRRKVNFPLVGIFSQRKKDGPNPLGLCTVKLIKHHTRSIQVRWLEAIHGTPVLDIQPGFNEFLPRTEIVQPAWVTELMADYWK